MGAELKELKVDEKSKYFNTLGMAHKTFPSVMSRVREFTMEIIKDAPEQFKEKNLLEQQLSEVIKNAVRHGNKNNPVKKVKVWYRFDTKKRIIQVVVEDEGEGFKNLEDWNNFYLKRTYYIEKQDYDNMIKLINYRTLNSTEMDGGNALLAAIEYWNGGIIYNNRRNKVALIRMF